MRSRLLVAVLGIAAVLALVAVLALGGDDAPSAATTTTAAPSTTTTAAPPPQPPSWTVEIALARVGMLEVFREKPTTAPERDATTSTATTSVSAVSGSVEVVVSPDQNAALAVDATLLQDQAALELIEPDAPPLATSALAPVGSIGAAASEKPATVVPRAAPAPSLPFDPALTPIPTPGLEWGSELTESGWRFAAPTPSGNARVFLVAKREGEWVQLVLPTRPNSQVGWAHVDDLVLARHDWHIEVDVSDRLLRIWEGNRLEAETKVVVGKDATPTPLGRFYLNERVKPAEGTLYSPWILSTNAFSDSLERFSGEVPIFALHGGGYESTIGSAISNGCVRIPPEVLERVVPKIPMGTPVDIFA